MADNVQIVEKVAAAAGEAAYPVATDDVGGAHFQRIKMDVGADGQSRPVTDAAPLPVSLAALPPAPGDSSAAGTITALNGAVTLVAGANQSSFAVQITGAFTGTLVIEGTVNGIDWSPMAFRQSGGGPFLTVVRTAGVYRGNIAAMAAVRVRASTFTPGTPATVTIRASAAPGSVFLSTILATQTPAQFYASFPGGTVMFGSSTGIVPIAGGGGPAALLVNPAGSGVDLFFDVGNWGALAAGHFTRHTVTAAVINNGAVSRPVGNRGGGANVSLAKFYRGNVLTFSPPADDDPSVGQVLYVPANSNYDGYHAGSLVVRPGQHFLWYFKSSSNAATEIAVSVRWWELPTQG